MSEKKTAPTHSAAWHYSQAERYLSQASMLTDDPSLVGIERVRLPNPKAQEHLVAMAQVHATLALAGATVLAGQPHGHHGRKQMQAHAEGFGERE